MIEQDRIRFGDTTIHFEVRRSRRRKKKIALEVRNGRLQLAVPSRLTAEQVRFIMRKEAPRVIRQAAEVQLKAPGSVATLRHR